MSVEGDLNSPPMHCSLTLLPESCGRSSGRLAVHACHPNVPWPLMTLPVPPTGAHRDSEAPALPTGESRYAFGRNWAEFVVKSLSDERVAIAQRHLLNFLKLADLRGKTFLDIGCGSGIHSLGAFRAGAAKVISFDFDPDSVQTTRLVRRYAGAPGNWEVMQGSVLDRQFLDTLERADVAYSWGVLHHTGAMWQALEKAASVLEAEGVLYIALYCSDMCLSQPVEHWLRIKQRYNRANSLARRWMEWAHAWRSTFWPDLRKGRNPVKTIRGYQASRGMAFWTDIKDWLGGWPMEFASIAETKAFCKERLGLELINIAAGEANTEYLFRKRGAHTYWDDVTTRLRIEPLQGPFRHVQGYAWAAQVPRHGAGCDTGELSRRSRLMLFEDGDPVGFAHAPHAHIQAHGTGRYSHWGDSLVFSSTDNTDPNANGRTYAICAAFL